ncbi:MAG: HPr kinase/phosphatase C-terminal domain-containing protein [Alphaproteobacteria bacterium]|nr:HPr kinase/phosphatase C-terminal domain-containing protein [Alphaproteobacteria bacterium]
MLLHASCVAFQGKAVLLAGPSGVGKSDLALRLIDAGAQLVADDQVLLHREENLLHASPPLAIAGLMEIRAVGLMQMPYIMDIPVALYVELMPLDATLPRLPEPDPVFLLDQPVQRLRLHAFAASTPAKIKAALIYRMAHD